MLCEAAGCKRSKKGQTHDAIPNEGGVPCQKLPSATSSAKLLLHSILTTQLLGALTGHLRALNQSASSQVALLMI